MSKNLSGKGILNIIETLTPKMLDLVGEGDTILVWKLDLPGSSRNDRTFNEIKFTDSNLSHIAPIHSTQIKTLWTAITEVM